MPKDVEPAVLARLLDLQEEDSAITRLDHRLASLPESQKLADVNDQLNELETDLEIARKQHEELVREQDRIEGEIVLIDQKISKEEQRMYSGSVANPKELSSLQAEIQMLKKKKGSIEDALLEVMVQRDQAATTLESLEAERSVVAQESQELSKTVGELTGEIDEQLSTHRDARAAILNEIPSELLSLYDTLRRQKAGIGAAALRSGTCEGCHTKLPAKEVERVRSEGGLQRCDNCRRILVVI